MKRSRLPPKRDRPRRNEGRVKHGRIKPEAGAPPTALEAFHIGRIAQRGCLVCGAPSTVHHVTASIHGGRIARSHERIVPLCSRHHQKVFDPKASAPISVEGLGHPGFYRVHGIDLLGEAERLWLQTLRIKGIPVGRV